MTSSNPATTSTAFDSSTAEPFGPNRYIGAPVASSQASRCDDTCIIVLPIVIVACVGIILLLMLWRMKRRSVRNNNTGDSNSNQERTFSYDERFRGFITSCRKFNRQKKNNRKDIEMGYPTNAKKNGVAIGADIESATSTERGAELKSMKSMSGDTLRGVESTSNVSSKQGSQVQLATADVVADVWRDRKLGMES
ncbi:hypothetical protein MMC14_007029 [Varicellaria rhodocarpa]|nr:hypothetical protein [Varicellaria rhodocarpa]